MVAVSNLISSKIFFKSHSLDKTSKTRRENPSQKATQLFVGASTNNGQLSIKKYLFYIKSEVSLAPGSFKSHSTVAASTPLRNGWH
jgi:hypothetical protein